MAGLEDLPTEVSPDFLGLTSDTKTDFAQSLTIYGNPLLALRQSFCTSSSSFQVPTPCQSQANDSSVYSVWLPTLSEPDICWSAGTMPTTTGSIVTLRGQDPGNPKRGES